MGGAGAVRQRHVASNPGYHQLFEHAASVIRMHDVHAGNYIRQKNGSHIPIDVFSRASGLTKNDVCLLEK
jgi:hypothetical protein